ncbi:MAG: cysteine protease StiP family protein [Gammaproteobacteria bacterium]
MFTGSYPHTDVQILLKPIDIIDTPVMEKEALIQSGRRHYSELISFERLPSGRYLQVFHQAMAQNRQRMATDVARLAGLIADRHAGAITLVSLARAGTPVGVLIRHTLERHFQRRASHYSVSIIRDRGLDANALRYILDRGHRDTSLVFVDGWTGKGVIAGELAEAIATFNRVHGTEVSADLHVLADLSGSAAVAASVEDYLIPSSILNATISGLISRSILNRDYIGPDDFHGCRYYAEYAADDLSRWFVEALLTSIDSVMDRPLPPWRAPERPLLQEASRSFLQWAALHFGVGDPNRVKPGLGEATRVLLRRVPDRLLVRDPREPSVRHLLLLARERRVPVEHAPGLPYRAAALIRGLAHE